MSSLAEAYYAQCTERDLSRRFKKMPNGLWLCKCGTAPFDTEGSLTHRCGTQTASVVPAIEIPLIRIDTLISTVVRLGEK